MMTEDRVARVLDLHEEGPGEFVLIVGPGDGSFERWRLPASLVRKVARESISLALDHGASCSGGLPCGPQDR